MSTAPRSEPTLAIVIPAYKPDFLALTLESIAKQDSGRGGFRVYVGDDASPANLELICRPFLDCIDLRFVRFAGNLGQHSLIAHWNRCVQLTAEPWVWVFGDDDLFEPPCVRLALDAIAAEGDRFDLFHFNVRTIDAQGQVLREEPEFAPTTTARAFAAARLKFELASYAPDYVFSRRAFERIGGFIDFPLAWCSDDATWIAMAGAKGIRTIEGAKVRWRLSGQNISSQSPGTVDRKLAALVDFLVWLHANLQANPALEGDKGNADVLALTPSWLYRQMRIMGGRFWPRHALRVAWRLRHLPEHGVLRDLQRMLRFDLRKR